MNANYDRIAAIYDPLSRLVFGKAQVNAQVKLLHAIKPNARILLVGGGTGWLLEEIAGIYFSGLRLVYIDNSARMTAMARSKYFGRNKIMFETKSIEDFQTVEHFDIIITPFLFDNFKEEKAEMIFTKLDKMLVLNGKWLYTDFAKTSVTSRFWQRILLKLMYRFFNSIASVPTNELPEMHTHFKRNNYKIILKSAHYRGFIEGIIYQKSTDRGAIPSE